METSVLSNKMVISVDDERLCDLSQKNLHFYAKYSSFVLRVLQKPAFQKFLDWMLKKEEIQVGTIRGVYVKTLPSRKQNGQGIAGKCDSARGKIRIYPKTIRFCQMFKQKFGRSSLFLYTGNRARAALIHELLHLKYAEDEKTVRELSEEYFCLFAPRNSPENSHAICVNSMIFQPNRIKKFSPKTSDNSHLRSN